MLNILERQTDNCNILAFSFREELAESSEV